MSNQIHEALEARVRRLEDERDIVRLLYEYAHALDYGPLEAFLDVFQESGRWERVASSRLPRRSFEAKSGLEAMWTVHSHAPEYYHKHVVVNPRVTVQGDVGQAVSYLVFICDHPQGPYIRAFSRCTDTVSRSADGNWRIQERRAELESWSNHDYPPPPWQGLPDVVKEMPDSTPEAGPT